MNNTPISSSDRINFLQEVPREVAGHILSFCDPATIQALATATIGLSATTIEQTNLNKCREIKQFIDNLLSRLSDKDNAFQKESLKTLRNSLKMEFPNLILLKQYIFSIKGKIIDILLRLSEAELSKIKSIALPSFFSDIFEVMDYKKLEQTINDPMISSRERGRAYRLFVFRLLENKAFDKAIELVNSIPNRLFRQDLLREICRHLINDKAFDKAAEVARTTNDEETLSFVLCDISGALMRAKAFDQAIEIARDIPNVKVRGNILRAISLALIADKAFDKAVEVARLIPEYDGADMVLRNISHAFVAQNNDFDRAIEVANLIPNIWRSMVLSELASGLIEQKQLEKASELSKTIPDVRIRESVLQELAKAFVDSCLQTS